MEKVFGEEMKAQLKEHPILFSVISLCIVVCVVLGIIGVFLGVIQRDGDKLLVGIMLLTLCPLISIYAYTVFASWGRV